MKQLYLIIIMREALLMKFKITLYIYIKLDKNFV